MNVSPSGAYSRMAAGSLLRKQRFTSSEDIYPSYELGISHPRPPIPNVRIPKAGPQARSPPRRPHSKTSRPCQRQSGSHHVSCRTVSQTTGPIRASHTTILHGISKMAGAVSGAVILDGILVGPHTYPALEEDKIPGGQFYLLSLAIGGAGTDSLPNLDGSR